MQSSISCYDSYIYLKSNSKKIRVWKLDADQTHDTFFKYLEEKTNNTRSYEYNIFMKGSYIDSETN